MISKNYPLIDIGANLTHDSFTTDLDQIIEEAQQAGIEHIIVTGTSVHGSQDAALLAEQHPGFLSSTAGIHPHEAAQCDVEALDQIRTMATGSTVRAVGETGMDYFRDFSPRKDQQEAFASHLQLAAELQFPVFLHQRDAHEDFIAILRNYRNAIPRGVVHCFTGTEMELRDYLDLDMYIGITGWICDERRGQHLHDCISLIPENRLMLETDAPYLLPRTIKPKPSSRRNKPSNLVYILETVANCLGKEEKIIAEQTTANARVFFDL
jgi:TatD DNase family protein